jgi:cytochrome c oxidase subunit II
VFASTQDDFSRAFSSYAWVLGSLFVIALSTIAALLVRYRERGEGEVSRVTENRLVESGAVLVFALVAAFLIARTFSIEDGEDSLAAGPAVRVEAIAYQWGWEFDYPGTAIRIIGQNGKPPTLVVPAGKTVQVSLRTRDVLHSFWVPALRYKRDAIPGVTGRFDVTVPLGYHAGSCALFCGLHHAEMRFAVRGVDATAWASFLARGRSQ